LQSSRRFPFNKGKGEYIKKTAVDPNNFFFIGFLVVNFQQVFSSPIWKNSSSIGNFRNVALNGRAKSRWCRCVWDCTSIVIYKIFYNPIDRFVLAMKLVETQFMVNKQTNDRKADHAYRQAGDFDDSGGPVTEEITDRYVEIIFKHKLFVS
jgi:hypothetical protein